MGFRPNFLRTETLLDIYPCKITWAIEPSTKNIRMDTDIQYYFSIQFQIHSTHRQTLTSPRYSLPTLVPRLTFIQHPDSAVMGVCKFSASAMVRSALQTCKTDQNWHGGILTWCSLKTKPAWCTLFASMGVHAYCQKFETPPQCR